MAKSASMPRLQLPPTAVKEGALIEHAVDVDASRKRRDREREPIGQEEKYQMALSNALLSFGA